MKKQFQLIANRLSRFILKRKISLSVLLFILICYYFCLPSPLFNEPYSTVLEDRDHKLLSARISDDGQWRFPQIQQVPERFKEAIVTFEDKRFFHHPGFDPLAFSRALKKNILKGRVVNGGSTITMQVIRLSRKGKKRTYFEKLIELVLATRLELSESKESILQLYASHAPFGGNVVGLEAAAWRYFGRSPEDLSWAESATLAVLPNSPFLVYPGKNSHTLLIKRNRLLYALFQKGKIDKVGYELALQESLPSAPHTLPRLTPHLLDRCIKEGHKGERIHTTISKELQQRILDIIAHHAEQLRGNEVHNAACIIIKPINGEVLAYVGNTVNDEGSQVDIITSPRSSGSILKPLLFAAMLHEGQLYPETLIPDIPTQISGFAPENFNLTYDGAIPAKQALARSLNVPAVRMLQQYGIEKFHHLLKKLGMSTLSFHADHYGLSLILGGAETTLWDASSIYSNLAQDLQLKNSSHKTHYIFQPEKSEEKKVSPFDRASEWLTFESIQEVARPDEESSWRMFSSGRKVAWKTGTSFGFRDAWAIGTTPEYVVGTWAGNADGEGRPELTGINCAAPILFDVFGILPQTGWFNKPEEEFEKIEICTKSGYRALSICTEKAWRHVPKAGLRMSACPYHQTIHLNKEGTYRVNLECEDDIRSESYFVLPPSLEWYYKKNDPLYKVLPPLKQGCSTAKEQRNMEFIYPRETHDILIPVGFDGKPGKLVAAIAHRRPNTKVHWHLDNEFLETSTGFHEISFTPEAGEHTLTAIDESGETVSQRFRVIDKTK